MERPAVHVGGGGKIQHVVVVMLENRSFDHMLGFLKQLNPEIDGLDGTETCPYDPTNPSAGSAQVSNEATYITTPDPSHSLNGTTDQVFGYSAPTDPAPMNGFVLNYAQDGDSAARGANILKCFDPSSVSCISGLAMEFAVFDRWYADLPGPTQPNRMFIHSATSYGATTNDEVQLALGYPQKTIFDALYEAGYTWRDYFQDVPSVLVMRNCRDPKYWDCYGDIARFHSDCKEGKLPAYSFVEPAWFDFFSYMASDEHPPHDVKYGEYFLADVYESLRASPLWNNTLMIITFDEHGGFYDHVPTPQKGIPPPDDKTPPPDQPPFDFKRLGLRVPCVMISPWIDKRTVIHEPTDAPDGPRYCNSSVPATLKKMFGLKSFLTARDAWAATFEGLFDVRDAPRTDCPLKLKRPGTKREQQLWAKYSGKGVTPEGMKECLARGIFSTRPLTDLQREVISIAKGITKPVSEEHPTIDDYLVQAEEEVLETEHHGAIFVRKQTAQFLRVLKEQHARQTGDAWVLL